jgi:hypothetical protein
MVEPNSAPPATLPILGSGKHRDPSRGACFMEYTSLLAGERFSDSPQCVDPELASVLRDANDILGEEERPSLVPLLGRAIGLVVRWPDGLPPRKFFAFRPRTAAESEALELRTRLRRSVCQRFVAAVGMPQSARIWSWYERRARVSWLFWDLMCAPAPSASPDEYARRLIQRLELLHTCYESAAAELGLSRISAGQRTEAAVELQPLQG